MKVAFYALLILNFLSIQSLAQDKKPKVVVIKFSDFERDQKIESSPEVKSAAIKQNFAPTKLDSEILGLEEQLDQGVVYIQ